ncbi:MAG: endonuclease [Bacteroidetes bacterium GWF2_41_31]|nr:MAG: endonuclease [Bacteroidetes bacterium GWF2_41_31]OFZ07849.1 MAG: endonuclease [Bacteroidetes bacterium RIFOXYB12_FULL_41_6]
MTDHNYFVYIMTNFTKTVLYTGVTNDLERRIYEHYTGYNEGFTKKYNCKYLIYYEHYTFIDEAIEREKQIKRWRRRKKEFLINTINPSWKFLNDDIEGI